MGVEKAQTVSTIPGEKSHASTAVRRTLARYLGSDLRVVSTDDLWFRSSSVVRPPAALRPGSAGLKTMVARVSSKVSITRSAFFGVALRDCRMRSTVD